MGAQFGTAKLLRPFKGWETTYQGLDSRHQILWSPTDKDLNGLPFDPLIGHVEYADLLCNAMAVPLGARVFIWLPRLTYLSGGNRIGYQWVIGWRLRSLRCFILKKAGAYHLPFQSQRGVYHTGTPGTVPLPYAADGVIYEQTEVAGTGLQQQNFKQPESYSLPAFNTDGVRNPLQPDGTAMTIQQGILNPIGSSGAQTGAFMCVEKQAKGDELIVACLRADTALGVYNFGAGGVDEDMDTKVNDTDNPFLGVYVIVGTNT
jgi:hypothetical protein